ncbi:MAG TPA: SRPBCC family protein [Solirubrobacterales bacterium]|nr:SRPBCC family protein [Solirubrobacterales bacterium]
MGPFTVTTSIDAPRERIFDFICDLSTRPSWIDHFASEYHLARIPASGLGAAARFRVDAPAGVKYMETVISEADRPHEIVEHARGGRLDRITMRLVWELEPGPTTTVKLTFWTSSPSHFHRIREIGRERWWRRRWSKAISRMRDLIESGAAVPRVEIAGGDRVPSIAG